MSDGGNYVQCPYEASHLIEKARLQVHLVKCRKAQGTINFDNCPFNATHSIPSMEMQWHMSVCPDKNKVESKMFGSKNFNLDRFPIANDPVDLEESWDDMENPTYNPTEYAKKANVRRVLNVDSKAKRRNFRMEERARLSNLSGASSSDMPLMHNAQVPSRRPQTHQASTRVKEEDPFEIDTLPERHQKEEFKQPPENVMKEEEWKTVPKGKGRGRGIRPKQ